MKKLMSLALAVIVASAAGLGAARADAPAGDKADKPAPAEKAPRAVAPLTDESLAAMLDNMGYEYKAEKLEKTTIYHLTAEQGTWTYYIDVSLSNDKDELWISSSVADLPADGKAPAAVLQRLLEETDAIGPAAVYVDAKFKKVKVAMPLLNRGGVTPVVFHTYFSDYMKDVTEVQKLCDFSQPGEKADAKTADGKK